MGKQITWQNASPADWEQARQREEFIRPFAAQPSQPALVGLSERERILASALPVFRWPSLSRASSGLACLA